MSVTLPDETKVDDWLREKEIQHGIRELNYNPALRPDCGPQLLEVFKKPLSFYVRTHIAEALFARRLSRAQKQDAVDVLLTFIKDNAERWGTLESLVSNELPRNVDARQVDQIGEMLSDPRYGPLRHGFADVLQKIGNEQAIAYLRRASLDPLTAHFALVALARLHVSDTPALCVTALKLPKVLYKEGIRETLSKLKRQLTRKPIVRSHTTIESVPEGLKEWSINLDGRDLPKVLRKIQRCTARGFTKAEVKEVRMAVDELAVDQDVRFRFEVSFGGEDMALWLEVFCDDEDAYDLAVFTVPALVDRIEEEPPY